jgi:hypothetical protein
LDLVYHLGFDFLAATDYKAHEQLTTVKQADQKRSSMNISPVAERK